MDKKGYDFWVGLFVVAGILAFFYIALRIGSFGSLKIENPYSVLAYFENIGGLKPRAAVKSAGVVVGRVSDIELDSDKFKAKVSLLIDGRYHFPKDTSAAILTSGLLGDQYIGLEAGGDEENLGPGDEIIITQSAVVLERLIGQFLYQQSGEKK
jgi:phospholipid/cholesterol/gamma-HCH transport system substrate-binding protein